jgi:hypothetical protein
MQKLDVARITKDKQETAWNLANEVLYRLCRKYPRHENEEEIVAKVWLIGRSYSAAIERRRTLLEITGDEFYTDVVGPRMREAGIDGWLEPLKNCKRPTLDNWAHIIAAHKRLTNLFQQITGLEKRSLASKYLHFHFPQLFYIYDSRAVSALAKVTDRVKMLAPVEYDDAYATYFFRCMNLVTRLELEHSIYLSPRRLDDYLLGLS